MLEKYLPGLFENKPDDGGGSFDEIAGLNLLEVEDRISKLYLQATSETNPIPTLQLVDLALPLTARATDLRRGEGTAVFDALRKVEEVEGKVVFWEGYNGFLNGLKGQVESIVQIGVRIAKQFDSEKGKDSPLVALEFIKNSTINSGWLKKIEDSFNKNNVSEEVRAMIFLDLSASAALSKIRDSAKRMIDPTKQKSSTIEEGREVDFWKHKFKGTMRYPGINICRGFMTRVMPVVRAKAEEIYGDDAERALRIWRAVLHMETSRLTNLAKNLDVVRNSVFQPLGSGDVSSAEKAMKNAILKFPNAFSISTKRSFGIDE